VKPRFNGAGLHVEERGRGRGHGEPTLVFLHYFGGSSRAWTYVAAALDSDYRCVMPDLRGFGDSDPLPADFSIADAADDVIGLVHAMQIQRYVLIGHSMGGKIAMAVAARQPIGLAALVLLAPSPPTPEPIEESERAHLLATHGDRFAVEQTARDIVAQPLPALVFEQVVQDSLRSSRAAWKWWIESGSRETITAELKRINGWVSVRSGALDTVIPAAVVEREVVRRIAGVTMSVAENCGHLLPLEAPALVAQYVRSVALTTGNEAL